MRSRFRRRPDCRRVAKVLQSYLDGELPESQVDEVARHLEECERCGIDADIYQRVKRSLEQLSTTPDPDALDRLRAYADGLAGGDSPGT